MNPLLLSPEVEQGNDENEHEQHHGLRCGIAKLVAAKGVAVDFHHHGGVGVGGGAHG